MWLGETSLSIFSVYFYRIESGSTIYPPLFSQIVTRIVICHQINWAYCATCTFRSSKLECVFLQAAEQFTWLEELVFLKCNYSVNPIGLLFALMYVGLGVHCAHFAWLASTFNYSILTTMHHYLIVFIQPMLYVAYCMVVTVKFTFVICWMWFIVKSTSFVSMSIRVEVVLM